MEKHHPPTITHEQFNCARCGVYSDQVWFLMAARPAKWKYNLSLPPPSPHTTQDPYEAKSLVADPVRLYEGAKPFLLQPSQGSQFIPQTESDLILQGFSVSICVKCKEPTLWRDRDMLYPSFGGIESPNPDLSVEIRNDYNEAAAIVNGSPRGAAALLRLCVQNLCVQLDLPGKNINDDIGALVKRGLNPEVQQALDALRVIGNNAVHALEMDLRDDRDTAISLFGLVNYIANQMLTYPKRLQEIFEKLPEGARAAIHKRDKGA